MTTTVLPHVEPGDLITAGQMNDLIDRLNSIDERLAAVEQNGAQSGADVVITAIEPPSGNLKVGELLRVHGANFGFSVGSHRVYIDDLRVNAFESGSSDQLLNFKIPLTITDAPVNGRPAVLTVSNATSSTQRTLILRSAMTLAGAADVNFINVQPATPTANGQATFQFQVVSQANLEATFALTASVISAVSQSLWTSAVRLLDSNQVEIPGGQVTLTPGQSKTVFVAINPIPNVPNGTAFTVALNVVSGTVSGSSGNMPFAVGSAVQQPDATITLNAPTADIVSGAATLNSTSLTASNGAIVNLSFPSTFTVQGNYDIVPSLKNGATNWALLVAAVTQNPLPVLQTEINAGGGKASKNIVIAIQRNAGATAGTLEVKVTRQGQTQNRTRTLLLQLS
jgi:hypothetical protein